VKPWLLIVVLVTVLLSAASGATPTSATATSATTTQEARVAIPATSYLYRFKLRREVLARFGSTDNVALIAGQLHKESLWRADARSRYAVGMAQFVPATGEWLARDVCPDIGPYDPWSPDWSVRAIVCYDAWLHARVADAATPCDQWGFVLCSYNGGLGNLQRDQRLASANGADPAKWFDSVERFSARATWARTENRDYVRKILRDLEPAYIAAGWPGQSVCP